MSEKKEIKATAEKKEVKVAAITAPVNKTRVRRSFTNIVLAVFAKKAKKVSEEDFAEISKKVKDICEEFERTIEENKDAMKCRRRQEKQLEKMDRKTIEAYLKKLDK